MLLNFSIAYSPSSSQSVPMYIRDAVGAAFSWPVAAWVRARLSSVFGPKIDKIY